MTLCTRPECQTAAGCKCGAPRVPITVVMPATYSVKQPTMQLRWYGAVLEQAFILTSSAGVQEIIWEPVPTIT